MQEKSEEYLISRVILYDDHKAFELLIKRHQNDIKNLLLKLLNFNESALDDLYQEVMIRIYKYLKSFKGNSSFKTWIYKITYRVFIDAHKKSKKITQLKTDQEGRSQLLKNVYPKVESKMDAEIIISCLRPEEKVAIQLSYISGFSHQDIAEILDCPLGTVKSHIKRGKERIRKIYKR